MFDAVVVVVVVGGAAAVVVVVVVVVGGAVVGGGVPLCLAHGPALPRRASQRWAAASPAPAPTPYHQARAGPVGCATATHHQVWDPTVGTEGPTWAGGS